jgi:hypothetical protein
MQQSNPVNALSILLIALQSPAWRAFATPPVPFGSFKMELFSQ